MGRKRDVPEHFAPGGRPKKAFATREDAQAWLDAHHHRIGQVYRCPVCECWHVSMRHRTG